MVGTSDMITIRRQMDGLIGSKVKIRAQKGRKKVVILEGILQSTYPSIFIVEFQEEGREKSRTVSYSYSDLLTKEVELSFSHN